MVTLEWPMQHDVCGESTGLSGVLDKHTRRNSIVGTLIVEASPNCVSITSMYLHLDTPLSL